MHNEADLRERMSQLLPAHHLVRPFLGVGVLGGFTTFSTYAVGISGLLRPGTATRAAVARREVS